MRSDAGSTFHLRAAADSSIARAVAAASRITVHEPAIAVLPPVAWIFQPIFANIGFT